MDKRFTIRVVGHVTLGISQIWPDGDAPANPTADDVEALLSCDGPFPRSVADVMQEWNLEDGYSFAVEESR